MAKAGIVSLYKGQRVKSMLTTLPATYSLQFLGGVIDPSLTFSRATSATMYNSAGTLVYAPMNMLVQSQTLNTGWTLVGAPTVTVNNAGAPDGTSTLNQFTRTTTAASYAQQGITKLAASIAYTLSAYAKLGTVGQFFSMRIQGTYPARADVTFNLLTGVVSASTTGGSGFTASGTITPVGNGFFRCSVTTLSTDAATGLSTFVSFSTNNIQVDGTDSVTNSNGYVWGLLLELASADSPHTYNATVASTYQGPRFDYDPLALTLKGIQIEQQITNLFLFSEDLSNAAWTPAGGGVVLGNQTTAPTLFTTAAKLNETAVTSTFNVRQAVTVAAGAVTVSFMVKQAERQRVLIRENTLTGNSVSFDLTNGGSVVTAVSATGTIKYAGNGYYAVTMTHSPGAGTYSYGLFLLLANGAVFADATYAGTAGSGVYATSAQIEQLGFATSHITTTTAAATRAVDNMNTNTTAWFNITQGTTFGEAITNGVNGAANIFSISSFTFPGIKNVTLAGATYNGTLELDTANLTSLGAVTKVGIAYSAGGRSLAMNGGNVVTDAQTYTFGSLTGFFGTLGGASQSINGWMRYFSYYNTRLSDAQLKTISGQL